MTETTAATETTPEAPTKSGRGPTRPAIVAADLIDALTKAGPETAKEFCDGLSIGFTARLAKEAARELRKDLAAYIKSREGVIAQNERVAEFLATAEKLPAQMRAFVVAAVTPEQVEQVEPTAEPQ